MNKLINKTENGRVFKCSNCGAIHVEYKNLNFNFSEEQYQHFAKYINELDGSEWEYKNRNSYYRRKIIIPIGHKNFNVLLNNNELQELKQLFNEKKQKNSVFENFNIMNMNIITYLN